MPGSGFQLAPNEILNSFIEGTRQREHREQTAKENQYKQDMLKLHQDEVAASVKHLRALTDTAAFNLNEQVRQRIESGAVPEAVPRIGLPTGTPAQPQTPGQIPVQGGQLPGGITRVPMQGSPNPPQDLGPAQQVAVGYTDPATGTTFAPGSYRTPDEALKAEANRVKTIGAANAQVAGQTAEAEEAAKLPYHLKNLEAMQTFQREKDIRDRNSMERIAAGNNTATIKGHQIMANSHLLGIKMQQGATPDVIGAISQRVATGEPMEEVAKNLKLNRGQIAAWETANNGVLYPLNKGQSAALNSVGSLFAQDGTVDKMESFAQHYSADTQLGATVKKLLLKPASSLNAHEAVILSEYESLQAEAVKAGRAIMGDENLRASNLFKEQGKEVFPDIKYNQAENIKRVQRFKSEAVGVVKNKLTGVPQAELERYAAQRNIPLKVGQVSSSGGDSIPNVSSQAEFDKLPRGVVYMEGGKKYRKP